MRRNTRAVRRFCTIVLVAVSAPLTTAASLPHQADDNTPSSPVSVAADNQCVGAGAVGTCQDAAYQELIAVHQAAAGIDYETAKRDVDDWIVLMLAPYVHSSWDVQRWYPASIRAGWLPEEWRCLSKVIWKESNGQPDVRAYDDDDDSYGLTQMNMKAHRSWVTAFFGSPEALYDGTNNLMAARALYVRAGWSPWKPFRCK